MANVLLQLFKSLAKVVHGYPLLCYSRSLTSFHINAFCLCSDTLMANRLSSITFHLIRQQPPYSNQETK
jgi:hypothetical protein